MPSNVKERDHLLAATAGTASQSKRMSRTLAHRLCTLHRAARAYRQTMLRRLRAACLAQANAAPVYRVTTSTTRELMWLASCR